MDPKDKLAVAKHLSNRPQGAPAEACRRSACSRAYYAAFLVARAALQQAKLTPPRDKVHRWVIRALKSSTNADVKKLGGSLETVRDWRNKADYDVAQAWPTFPYDMAVKAAESIINELVALQASAPRLGIPPGFKG